MIQNQTDQELVQSYLEGEVSSIETLINRHKILLLKSSNLFTKVNTVMMGNFYPG
jgi:hypothetical protein